MLIAPLQDELAAQGSDMGTSGNEKHYVKWAKEATDAQGKRVAGNAMAVIKKIYKKESVSYTHLDVYKRQDYDL